MGKASHVAVIRWKGNEVERTPIISFERAAKIAQGYVEQMASDIQALYGARVKQDDWQFWHDEDDCTPLCEVDVVNTRFEKGK